MRTWRRFDDRIIGRVLAEHQRERTPDEQHGHHDVVTFHRRTSPVDIRVDAKLTGNGNVGIGMDVDACGGATGATVVVADAGFGNATVVPTLDELAAATRAVEEEGEAGDAANANDDIGGADA